MALQGTLDSFALNDVLRLLSSSRKTGRLVVNGERGSSSLWLSVGDLVGGATTGDPAATELVDIVFDVLRYEAGSFIFESDAVCPSPIDPAPVGAVLDQAEAFLAEWRDIVAVVPSVNSWITLAPMLPHPEVVVDQACWTSVVAVGGGITVSDLGSLFRLGELPVCRLVRALAHAGFIQVGAAQRVEVPVPVPEPVAEIPAEPFAESTTDVSSDAGLPSRKTGEEDVFGDFDPFGGEADVEEGLAGMALPSLTITGLTDDPFAPESFPNAEPASDGGSWDAWVNDDEIDEGADIAAGLSMLSPQAAQAIAAADTDDGVDSGSPSGFLGKR